MYQFQNQKAERLYQDLSTLVQIQFQLDNSLSENACMDFDEDNRSVIIKFKDDADEVADITHELLHVRMQIKDSYTLLSWRTGDPLATVEIQEAVHKIRNIVDDTYIFYSLYEEFGMFPISQIFIRESRKDLKDGRIRCIQELHGVNKTLEGAWRLRIADISKHYFSSSMTSNQKSIATDYLNRFATSDPEIDTVFSFIKSNITRESVMNPTDHGSALELLRDRMGFSQSLLHLTTRQKEGCRWLLREIT